eukprot:SAG25_NODE_1572_length_2749_cov_1.356226_1_plen_183_part_00
MYNNRLWHLKYGMPGMRRYTLSTVVSVHPYFTQGRLELVWIDKFTYKVVSTKVERVRTDYFHRREAQVTYAIEFDIGALEWTIAHNYPLSAFFSDVCALTVVMALGSWCLKHYHRYRNIPDKLIQQHFGVSANSAEQAAIDLRQDQGDKEQQSEIDAIRQEMNKQAAELEAIKQQLAHPTAV